MMSGKRGNKIRQIVKLRQFVKKWRILALRRTNSRTSGIGCTLSPRFRHHSLFFYDSEEECCRSPETPPPGVPEGSLAVYVGRERRRFIIPTKYLSRPLFRTLLDKAEEEYGFDHQGALTIPCEVPMFNKVLRILDRNDPAAHKNLSFEDLLNFYSKETDCCGTQAYAKGLTPSNRVSPGALQRTFG